MTPLFHNYYYYQQKAWNPVCFLCDFCSADCNRTTQTFSQVQSLGSVLWLRREAGVWLNCGGNSIRVVLSFPFLLYINTPPSVLFASLLPLALCFSCRPRQRADKSPTLLSVAPLISFSSDSEIQWNVGSLSQCSLNDLYIIDTRPGRANESGLVSPSGQDDAFFGFRWSISSPLGT